VLFGFQVVGNSERSPWLIEKTDILL